MKLCSRGFVRLRDQTETIISPLPPYLWPTTLVWRWHTYAWSGDNLKTIYISIVTIPMVTKIEKVVTYNEELLLIKLLGPSITLFCEVSWYIKCFISLLAIDQWPPNMTKWWLSVTWQSGTQCEGLPPINLSNPSNMCSWEVTWQINFISSLSQCLWSLRLIRMVTCWKELQPVNLHDHSLRWSFKMTRCIKYMVSPPSEDSCTPN